METGVCRQHYSLNNLLIMIVLFSGGIEHWKSKQKSQPNDNTDVSMTTSLGTNNVDDDKVKEVKDKESKSKKKNTVS